jgi:hypothetical protein
MKTLVAMLSLLGITGCYFQHTTLEDLQIVEFGTFQKTNQSRDMNAPNVLGGQRHAVAEAILLERTTDVYARRGMSFGMRVKIVGKPAGGVVPCTTKYFHPKLTDPATGRSTDNEQFDSVAVIGHDDYVGYTFDEEWELVPGEWTIQLSVGPNLKVEKTFRVITTSAPN